MTTLWKAIPIKEYEHIMSGREKAEESPVQNSNEHLLEFLPKKMQEKARKVLQAINQNADFHWKSSGEIITNGQEIPYSHLSDLLYLAVRPHPIRNPNIPGLNEFINAIKSNNVPTSLLGLPFIKLMEEKENQLDKFKWINFNKL